jgi:hypothetical protein
MRFREIFKVLGYGKMSYLRKGNEHTVKSTDLVCEEKIIVIEQSTIKILYME